MNALGALILMALLVVVLAAPRKIAALGMLAGMLFLPQAQQINLGGFNLFAMRILGYFVFARVILRGEFSLSAMNRVDKALVLLYSATTIIFCLRSDKGVAYSIANSLDAMCCYFAFRGLVQDMDDLKALLRSFPVILAPFTVMVLMESVTHRNSFAPLGGLSFGWIREGRLRCFGSFRNPDLLGTVGATFFPLFTALALIKEKRGLAYVGVALCLLIVYASNAGGPVSATAAGVIGWACWRIRRRMQLVRRCMAGGVILAALLMKAPVWYLIARLGAVTGGDGWHRSYLLDVSFQHFSEWCLFGISFERTAEWFPYTLSTTGAADITNQFLSFGFNAGFGMIILFIMLLAKTFGALGKAMSAVRAQDEAGSEKELILWGLGVTLACHIVNWFGITYFDQSYVMFFLHIAAMSGIAYQVIENPTDSIIRNSADTADHQLEPRMQYEPINT